MLNNKQVIAHRGASAYAPENTLASFYKAHDFGAQMIELDVMLSADGEPFVIHDHTLSRTTNARGEVGLVTSDYLRTLDAGHHFGHRFKGEKLTHFRDLIAWLLTTNLHVNIEIKPYNREMAKKTAMAVLSYINSYWPHDKPMPLVSSFEWEALALCRSLSPELPLGLLLHTWDKNWQQKAEELRCYSIHFNSRVLTAKRVDAIKKAGFQLYVYTVNRRSRAKKLFSWGVDAVFSDYPDLLL